MVEAYKKLFTNYTNFADRTTRKDYWLAVLMNVLVAFGISIIATILNKVANTTMFSWLSTIYSLALLIPGLAVCVRRLHDTNKSGWYVLFTLIPFVGGIILIVFLCLPAVNEGNKYGNVL